MTAIRITLPIPPSVNAMYRNVPGRGRVSTAALVNWKAAAGWQLKSQRPNPITGFYRFALYLPQDMRGDIDGRLKAPIDLMVSHSITPDDRFAKSVTAERSDLVGPGECLIVIEAA